MKKRLASSLALALVAAGALVLALTGGASAASSLPTLNIALSGATGITVSGSASTGAVSISATFSGKLPRGSQGPSFGIVRLNPGVTIQQAAGAVSSHHGDLNALTPYGSLVVNSAAPNTVQTVLQPGYTYVALNDTSQNGTPGFAPFSVTQSSSPAPLPKAKATQTTIDFGFRGPRLLHSGTIVRVKNNGDLVHMLILQGVRSRAAGKKVIAALRAGNERRARKFSTRRFAALLLPASPGALQQEVLNAKPGYYVEVCFMDTQDHRDHARLGMLRLVRVVK